MVALIYTGLAICLAIPLVIGLILVIVYAETKYLDDIIEGNDE